MKMFLITNLKLQNILKSYATIITVSLKILEYLFLCKIYKNLLVVNIKTP
jgi:hypothetical protein